MEGWVRSANPGRINSIYDYEKQRLWPTEELDTYQDDKISIRALLFGGEGGSLFFFFFKCVRAVRGFHDARE